MADVVAPIASARKSLGEYKPLLVWKLPHGDRTLVCEKSPERAARWTREGVVKGNRLARGTTYATREDAIAAAKAHAEISRADAERRLALYTEQGRPESALQRIRDEIATWTVA